MWHKINHGRMSGHDIKPVHFASIDLRVCVLRQLEYSHAMSDWMHAADGLHSTFTAVSRAMYRRTATLTYFKQSVRV